MSWHVTILSLHVPAVYSMRFTFQCFLRPTFHIVLPSSHAAVVEVCVVYGRIYAIREYSDRLVCIASTQWT